MTFWGWISQGQVATYDRLGGHICNVFMSNFFRNWTYQNLLKTG